MKTTTMTTTTMAMRLFPVVLAVAAVTLFLAARPSDDVVLYVDAAPIEITAPALAKSAVPADELALLTTAAIESGAPIIANAAPIVVHAMANVAAAPVLYVDAPAIVIHAPAVSTKLACAAPTQHGC